MGGRLSFGYRITPDLSISAGVTGQNVDITDARDETVLADILGDSPDPRSLAEHIFLLLEGGIVHRGIDGDDHRLTHARRIVEDLVAA